VRKILSFCKKRASHRPEKGGVGKANFTSQGVLHKRGTFGRGKKTFPVERKFTPGPEGIQSFNMEESSRTQDGEVVSGACARGKRALRTGGNVMKERGCDLENGRSV